MNQTRQSMGMKMDSMGGNPGMRPGMQPAMGGQVSCCHCSSRCLDAKKKTKIGMIALTVDIFVIVRSFETWIQNPNQTVFDSRASSTLR